MDALVGVADYLQMPVPGPYPFSLWTQGFWVLVAQWERSRGGPGLVPLQVWRLWWGLRVCDREGTDQEAVWGRTGWCDAFLGAQTWMKGEVGPASPSADTCSASLRQWLTPRFRLEWGMDGTASQIPTPDFPDFLFFFFFSFFGTLLIFIVK